MNIFNAQHFHMTQTVVLKSTTEKAETMDLKYIIQFPTIY